jgi:hypothetical protein
LLWADPCSDVFFHYFELSISWIAFSSALESAAGCSLGFIDYKLVTGNTKELLLAMRKKRLAFAKFCFLMSILTLLLLDKPDSYCVVPLIIG